MNRKVQYRYYAIPKESDKWENVIKGRKYRIYNAEAIEFIQKHGYIRLHGNHRGGAVVPVKLVIEEHITIVNSTTYDKEITETKNYNTPEIY